MDELTKGNEKMETYLDLRIIRNGTSVEIWTVGSITPKKYRFGKVSTMEAYINTKKAEAKELDTLPASIRTENSEYSWNNDCILKSWEN